MNYEAAVRAIGIVRSPIKSRDEAPRQGFEGAPDVWLEIDPAYADAIVGLTEGSEIIVISWFHHANRDELQTHPRNDPNLPLTGVFATRSPDRPNPLGLHKATLRQISGLRLLAGPIEAIDGTPVIDIKPALRDTNDQFPARVF